MSNIVKYRGYNSNRGPSNAIWHDCPMEDIRVHGAGPWVDEDFDKTGLITAPTTIASLVGIGWSGFSSTASQITLDDASGIKLAETDDDEGTSIFLEQHPFRISRSKGALWLEARFKTLLTATTENRFFIGLMDTTAVTAAVPLTATGALADVNLVGFHYPDANTTTFDFSYKSDGVTAVAVNSGVATIAADTYVKAGFKVIPGGDWLVESYINGVLQATKTLVQSAAPGASNGYTIDGNGTRTAVGGFPNDIDLGLVCAMSCGAAAANNVFTLDWIRCYQLDV